MSDSGNGGIYAHRPLNSRSFKVWLLNARDYMADWKVCQGMRANWQRP